MEYKEHKNIYQKSDNVIKLCKKVIVQYNSQYKFDDSLRAPLMKLVLVHIFNYENCI